MAKPGPDQQTVKIGRTPNAGWIEVENTPFTGKHPNLPTKLGGRAPRPEVKRWWGTVSAMPHCRLWSDSDWLFAIETAVLKQQCYGDDATTALWVEVRRREDALGVTAEARRKLGIRYVDPVEVESAGAPAAGKVSSLDDRRRRLSAS